MTKEDKYFDELFRGKFADYEVKPPAYVWEKIAEVQQQKRRKKLFLYLKIIGVAAVVLMAFVFGWQINNQLQNNELQPAVVENPEQVISDQPGQGFQVDEEQAITDILVSQPENVSSLSGSQKQVIEDASHNYAISSKKKTIVDNKEDHSDFSLLEAIGLTGLTIDNKKEILKATNKQNLAEGILTAEDVETIKRNEQLLAMDKSNEKTQVDNWQIAAMVTPNYSINQTSYESLYASNMSVPGSKEKLSLGGGLAVEYKAGKRLSIQSGVYYSQIEQGSSNGASDRAFTPNGGNYFADAGNTTEYLANANLQVKSDMVLLNASAGVVEVDNLPSNTRIGSNLEALAANNSVLLDPADFRQNFEYVEIPFNLRYKVIDQTFDVSLLGGFSTNLLIGNEVYIKNEAGVQNIGETKDMNRVNYSTTVGVGLSYGISDKVSMRVEPQVKYFLGSLNRNSAVSFKPYTIGVYTGLSYRF